MALPIYDARLITAINRVQQDINFPQFVVAGRGVGADYFVSKKDSLYDFTLWRSPVYQIGKNFDIIEIMFSIYPDITTNMSIVPVLYFDNEDSNSVGNTIDSTNYPNSDRLIRLTSKNFANSVHGKNNFFLELQFTGSALAVVELPISIDLEVEE